MIIYFLALISSVTPPMKNIMLPIQAEKIGVN